jgi:DNA polymerase III delta prime subunit
VDRPIREPSDRRQRPKIRSMEETGCRRRTFPVLPITPDDILSGREVRSLRRTLLRIIRPCGLCLLLIVTGSTCRRQVVATSPICSDDLRQADISLAEGDAKRAIGLYENYLRLSESSEDRAAVVFRLALLYSVPGDAENPERARQLLSAFLDEHPETGIGPEMRMVLDVGNHVERLLDRVRESRLEAERHHREVVALEDEVRSLTERLDRLEDEKEKSERARELAEAHLELRSRRIRQLAWELEEERRQHREVARLLEELKEIDLSRRRPR